MNKSLNGTSPTVISCYDLLDVAVAGKITDFTDGMYFGDPKTSYEQAQENQANYILDQANCSGDTCLLDIGCGYGRIVEKVNLRGGRGIGITVSRPQMERCRAKGLEVELMNYRNIPISWNNSFNALVANGSIEHFVQVKDVIEGRDDAIYREMFKIAHSLTVPGSKFVTTIMHDNGFQNPLEIIKGSEAHSRGSTNYHFSKVLVEDLGGWYPKKDQLERNARGYFVLENRQDGTQDYHWTSEAWLEAIKKGVKTNPQVWIAIANKIMKHGKKAISMLDTWAVAQSWMWQFRPDKNGITPTVLYRDTWKRIN